MNLSIEVDEYVPLSAEFLDTESGLASTEPLYWRCGNGKTSLLELGFHHQSGAIQSITLVSIDVMSVPSMNASGTPKHGDHEIENGVIAVDTELWKQSGNTFADKFIDHFNDQFSTIKHSDGLEFLLSSDANYHKRIVNSEFEFRVSAKGLLLSIMVSNLTDHQLDVLNSSASIESSA